MLGEYEQLAKLLQALRRPLRKQLRVSQVQRQRPDRHQRNGDNKRDAGALGKSGRAVAR